MGKLIKQKYPDISHKIIKKSSKKEQIKKSLDDSPTTKRKRTFFDQNEEPKAKQAKKTNASFLEKHEGIEICSSKVYTVDSHEGMRLETDENNSKDLFLHDELFDNYQNYVNNDFGFQILDEISLEGLDGITVEALWKRLSVALKKLTIGDTLKQLIWRFICNKKDIQFFKLCKPRGELDIYDRMKYLDSEIGVVLEPLCELRDTYPHELISQPDIQGSCSTFHTRTDITTQVINLDLKSAEQQYGTSLVMVADQKLRRFALFSECADPTAELGNMDYCILERIGRSRRHGELTQGNLSIASHYNMDPKSVFHYQKQLSQFNLLAKQSFYIKSALLDQNKSGRLLHLRRFYHKIKPKQMLIGEQIINVIKEKPGCRIEVRELRKIFEKLGQSVFKIMKCPEFRRFVKTTLVVYRDLYPNAKKSEYMRKSLPIEKFIPCKELINPYVNITANWSIEQDDSDNDNEEEEVITGGKIYNMECVKEVFYHILSKGRRGCTLQELEKLVNVDINLIRMCIRKLIAKNTIAMRKSDRGKQRYILYYASYLEKEDKEINLNPDPPKLPNPVLSKLKEKQRAAIEKSNQLPAGKEETSTKDHSFKYKYDINIPNIICPFFIRNIQQIICDIEMCDDWIKAAFNHKHKDYSIKLNTQFPKGEHSFEINRILSKISSDVAAKTVKTNFNFDRVYLSNISINYVTKTILLKAAFGDAVINADTLNCFSRKRQHESVSMDIDVDKERSKTGPGSDKLQYMGPKPVTLFSEKEGDLVVEILVSTPPSAFKNDIMYPTTNDLSERVVSRARIILRVIYEKMIFEDLHRLIKVIVDEEEAKEGYKKRIDRKSLARILKRLVEEGYIKIFKLSISNNKLTKTQTFGCHPSVSHTDSLIQSSCQQLKWKYFIGTSKKTTKPNVPKIKKTLNEKNQKGISPFRQSGVMNSVLELRELNKMKLKEINNKHNRKAARRYGFKPKFVRMRIIHEFLFYLIYCYDRNTRPLSDREVEQLFESYQIKVTKEDLKQIPNIYCKEISWKMFIPPLTNHAEWITGWALMCDVILRLPISVLCQIHNVSFEVRELSEVLSHPIKRFYLVKDLPENVRDPVLFKRKYLFDIHDSVCRLAWCGLIQFGPQKYKEKDQVFIYLNRMASLLDTTSSEPAYNKITDKEYKELKFFFNSLADVESFWFNTYGICLSTKLNRKLEGQLVTIFDPHSKAELVNALKSKTPQEALQDDNGDMPGDRRGAAGFDSSLWSHIVKNWFWANQKRCAGNTPVSGLRLEKLEKVLPRNLSYDELHTFGQSNKVYLTKPGQGNKVMLRKYVHVPLKPSKTVQTITRKITSRRKTMTAKTKQYFIDHLDRTIAKINGNIRIKWNKNEDRVLLLSLAANMLLTTNPKKQFIPYTVVRDVLRRACPESKNKTSRACQRRMRNHLLPRHHYIEDNVSNLLQMKPISEYYSALLDNIMKQKARARCVKYTDAQITVAFVILMSYLLKHDQDAMVCLQGNLNGNAANFDYLAEDQLEFTENNVNAIEETSEKYKYKDVVVEDDIKKDVLKSVIHSSLGCSGKPGRTFQLFKIYQKYSDNLILEALGELRRSQAVSFNRCVKKVEKTRWHTPFQLSNLYVFAQATTYDVTTFLEAYKSFLKLKDNSEFWDFSQETINSKRYGQLLGFNEFHSFWPAVEFKFYLPRSMIILNPHIKDHSELIDELAIRWQAKLKKILQDNADADLEPDNENDSRSKSHEADLVSVHKDDASTSEVDVAGKDSNDIYDFIDNNQNNPLDLTVEAGNAETIDRLKTWVTDCMDTETERRSPSPEFMSLGDPMPEEASEHQETNTQLDVESPEGYDEVDKISIYNLRRMFTKEQIPTLEEIKEDMLKYTSANDSDERIIPHITDLCPLLNRDVPESNLDEEKLERLKSHFITQYVVLEDIAVEPLEEDFYLVEYIQSASRNRHLWNKIASKLVIQRPGSMSDVYRVLEEENPTQSDLDLVTEIMNFVLERKSLGATGLEIKEHFRHREHHCSLELILQTLVDASIFLRVGICSVTFVHHIHQGPWIIETFRLSNDEQTVLEKKASSQKNVTEKIENQLKEKPLFSTFVMPWIKIDGTLNEDVLKTWLCNVLSHCLDNPRITMRKLCEKFCYLKPVDIYYLLEVLKELGCVELFAYDDNKSDLFSTWDLVAERDATFLDDFENMYVTPNNLSVTCMGSFFYRNNSL